MGQVIPLRREPEYDETYLERVRDAYNLLIEVEQRLMLMGLNLATAGVWKEWDEQMPVGTEFQFTDEMLMESGDDMVASLMELRGIVCAMVEVMGRER